MNTSNPNSLPAVKKISFTSTEMRVLFSDGREACVALAGYPRLAGATRKQLLNYEVEEDGYGIHWPDIDEDLSIPGMLRASSSPHKRAFARHLLGTCVVMGNDVVSRLSKKKPISIVKAFGVIRPAPTPPKKKHVSTVRRRKPARRKAAE